MAERNRDIPGFRHRVHEPEYARLGLPFCRRDSIRKLSVLLEEEAAAATGPDAKAARNPRDLPDGSA